MSYPEVKGKRFAAEVLHYQTGTCAIRITPPFTGSDAFYTNAIGHFPDVSLFHGVTAGNVTVVGVETKDNQPHPTKKRLEFIAGEIVNALDEVTASRGQWLY